MAGHSKWKQIKHKKAITDSKRGKAFTKLIKEISIAARLGGGDPAGNPRLRLLLEKAKEINMPLDNTQRAIKRGTGELPGVQYEEITYEGYGPYGMAVIVDTLTDSKNRTVAEFRRLFTSHGGTLGESGSVSWMFEKLGVIHGQTTLSEDELLEKLLDFDIKDVKKDEALVTITCEPKSLEVVKQAVKHLGITIVDAELEWIAKSPLTLPEDQAQKAYAFLEIVDDHDDVKNVYATLV
jgi:YebC/PmpR family DNA-binding regulatory protein